MDRQTDSGGAIIPIDLLLMCDNVNNVMSQCHERMPAMLRARPDLRSSIMRLRTPDCGDHNISDNIHVNTFDGAGCLSRAAIMQINSQSNSGKPHFSLLNKIKVVD